MPPTIRTLAVFALLVACTAGAPPGPLTRDSGTVVDPAELVALAAGPTSAGQLVAEAGRRGYAVERQEALSSLGRQLLVLRLPAGTDVPAAIRALEAAAPGTVVGRNHAYRADPDDVAQKGEPRSYAAALLDWPSRGCLAAVPVGMIDTPLDPTAPGLAGVRIETRDFTNGAAPDPHGTAIAELLAGPGRLNEVRLYHAAVVGEVAATTLPRVSTIWSVLSTGLHRRMSASSTSASPVPTTRSSTVALPPLRSTA